MPYRRLAVALAVASIAPLAGCNNDPGKGKPAAAVGVAATPAAAVFAEQGREIVPLDAQTAKVQFTGAKITGKHDGSFQQLAGKIALGATPEKSAVTLDIDAASIAVDSEKLTSHLKSPDFFDVARFPKVGFVSTSVRGAAPGTWEITGNLTLHGVTKAVTFPAKIAITDAAVTADATFALNRKDFGLVYPGKPDDLIRDEVAVTLTVRAPRKK